MQETLWCFFACLIISAVFVWKQQTEMQRHNGSLWREKRSPEWDTFINVSSHICGAKKKHQGESCSIRVSEFKCEQNTFPQLSHTLHMWPFTGQSVAMGNHQSTSKRALEGLLPRAILSTETHLTVCVTECRFQDADNSVSHPLPHKRNRNSSVSSLITAGKAFRGHAVLGYWARHFRKWNNYWAVQI